MKLAVDIGNSRIKWGFFESGRFVSTGDVPHSAEGPGAALRPILEGTWTPNEIWIANVAGTATGHAVAAALKSRFGLEPVFARSVTRAGDLQNGYADPAQLGVDRWLAMRAARARFPGPLAVVDAGTATTIDLIDATGRHLGGLIIPGVGLMQHSLHRETGDLASLSAGMPPAAVAISGPAVSVARDTATGIQRGAVYATCCLIRACMETFAGEDALLVLTGGDAAVLLAARSAEPTNGLGAGWKCEHRPLLVLEGLVFEGLEIAGSVPGPA